jgi:hypothetical protein
MYPGQTALVRPTEDRDDAPAVYHGHFSITHSSQDQFDLHNNHHNKLQLALPLYYCGVNKWDLTKEIGNNWLFQVKDHETRSIPMPNWVIKTLVERHEEAIG